jgi:hypothetical protein
MQVAVMLLYLTALFNLITGFLFGGGGLFLLLISAGDILGAYGMANEQKSGYIVALTFAIMPFALLIGLSVYYHRVLIPGILTLLMEVALVALLVHPQTREYKKIWFH